MNIAFELNGKQAETQVPVRSCLLLAVQAAFRKHHAMQCGFCTPGCTGDIAIIDALDEARAAYARK